MTLTITPNEDCTLYEISGQRAGELFRKVVSALVQGDNPTAGPQAIGPRGYCDIDNEVWQAARAAGVPVRAL